MTAAHRRATDRLVFLSATGFFAMILCSVWTPEPSSWEIALLSAALLSWALLLGGCLYAYAPRAGAPRAPRTDDFPHRRPRRDRIAWHLRMSLLGAALAFSLAFAVVAATSVAPQPSQRLANGISSWASLGLLAVGIGAFVASLRTRRLRPMLRVVALACGTAGLAQLSLNLWVESRIELLLQRHGEVTVRTDLTSLLSGLEVRHLGEVGGFASASWQAPCPSLSELTGDGAGGLVGLVVVGHTDQWRLRGGAAGGAESNRDLARRRARHVAACLAPSFSGPIVPLAGGALNLGSGLDDAQYAEDRIVEVFGLFTRPGELREETFTVRLERPAGLGRPKSVVAAAEPADGPELKASLP